MITSAGPVGDVPSFPKKDLSQIRLPDLTCSAMSSNIGKIPTYAQNQTFNGTYSVLNKGTGNSKSFTIKIFLVPNGTTGTLLNSIGVVNIPSLAANAEKKGDVIIHIPADLFPGEYILKESIDSGNVILESNENNNWCNLWGPPKIIVIEGLMFVDLVHPD